MSLPSNFDSAEDYFVAAVDFLSSFSWIYRQANISCLSSIESMPQDFKYYFLKLSNQELNMFPQVHEDLPDCPRSVLNYRQKLAALTPRAPLFASVDTAPSKRGNHQRKMSPKKLHEIQKLAAHIHSHCIDTQLLVDLGSGLGYLSEALFELNPRYLILGMEADEGRVLAARKRCRRLLPTAAAKSIIYQQARVGLDSHAVVDKSSTELARNNGCLQLSTMSIIGLHACADLSIYGMRLFLEMQYVKSLHIMPCCYHKLALQTKSESENEVKFQNFPLSGVLRRVVAQAPEPVCLNRPFLRLACQQTSARWHPDCTPEEHAAHGSEMFSRALAEALCNVGESVRCRKPAISKSEHEQPTFDDLKNKYQLLSKQTGEPQDWNPSHEMYFMELSSKYSNGKGPCLAEALTCLQTSMQKLCENVVLFDRLCYLEEAAEVQKLRIRVRYEQLLDEKVSPRCQVLIAEKLP